MLLKIEYLFLKFCAFQPNWNYNSKKTSKAERLINTKNDWQKYYDRTTSEQIYIYRI